ncbi:MAG: hypothetical protein U0Q16_15420 [Bryobacteraceae bacterium]
MFVRALPTVALAAVLPLCAQDLAGPTSGFVFDEVAKALRVINGVPGAAYLGGALARVDSASVSPDSKLAIAQVNGRLSLIRLADGSSTDLGEMAGSARIEWSSDSASAAVAGESNAAFRKLNATPERSRLADLAGITALAVAKDGSVFAAAADGLYTLGADARLVLAQDGISDIALAPNGDLYVTLSARKQIMRVRGVQDSPEMALFASAAAGLEDPVGIGISADGAVIFATDRAARALFAFSASGELTGRTELDFAPDAIERSGSYFRLNQRASAQDPLELFDAARAAVFFVPTQDLTATPVED